jgi:hypothetical protein
MIKYPAATRVARALHSQRFYRMASRSSAVTQVAAYAAWFVLLILAAIAAFQLNAAILVLADAVIHNDALRPAGWNSSSLANVQRLSVFVLGSLWLIAILWMENHLRSAVREGHLVREIGRLGGLLLALIAGCYLLLLLAV